MVISIRDLQTEGRTFIFILKAVEGFTLSVEVEGDLVML